MGVINEKSGNINHENRNEDRQENKTSATFEEAITETGFGKYNWFLLFIVGFPCITQVFNTVELSYVLPVAQCDLNLSLEDKGILNGIVFAGMIGSGFIWGYFCDALGRKKIIIYGYIVSGIFGLVGALSTNKTALMISKILTGLVLTGPFSATTSHIAEFHSTKYRGIVNLTRGIYFSFANLILPVLSWAILPRHWNINLIGLIELHSWNIFLLICTASTIMTGFLYICIPESPKFLMSVGRNNEALRVMQKIFSINKGRPMEEFPIKQLEQEVKDQCWKKIHVKAALKDGLKEVLNIFHRPYVTYLALACFNVFSLVMSLNTLKLWLPAIFQGISDYQNSHNGSSSSICIMLDQIKPHNISLIETCSVDTDNLTVYLNTFIVAFTRILAFVVSGTFIRLLGVKTLNIIICYTSALLMFAIYFATNTIMVTVLSAVGTAIGSVAENLLITLSLELFPTTLRTTAISIHLSLGRLGTIVGNIVFPHLVYLGCLPPFLYIGIFAAACGTMSFLFPSIENKPLH